MQLFQFNCNVVVNCLMQPVLLRREYYHFPISNKLFLSIALVASILSVLVGTNVIAQEKPIQEIADVVMKSVVLVVMTDEFGATVSYGSGFSIAPGVIATNFHVIEGSVSGKVISATRQIDVKILGELALSPESDLAIIAIDNLEIIPLEFAETSDLEVGDTVYAVGNPRGQTGTFSSGIVSGIRTDNENRIQTTAPVSPGSSGGPLINSDGKVVGIVVSQITQAQNINFAIPVERLRDLSESVGQLAPLGSSHDIDSRKADAEKQYLDGASGLPVLELGDFQIEVAQEGTQNLVHANQPLYVVNRYETVPMLNLPKDVEIRMPGTMRIKFRVKFDAGPLPLIRDDGVYSYYGVSPERYSASFPTTPLDFAGVRLLHTDGTMEWFLDNDKVDDSPLDNSHRIYKRKFKKEDFNLIENPTSGFKVSKITSQKYTYLGARGDEMVFLETIELPGRQNEREIIVRRDPFSKTIARFSGLVIECIRWDSQVLDYRVLKRPSLRDLTK